MSLKFMSASIPLAFPWLRKGHDFPNQPNEGMLGGEKEKHKKTDSQPAQKFFGQGSESILLTGAPRWTIDGWNLGV